MTKITRKELLQSGVPFAAVAAIAPGMLLKEITTSLLAALGQRVLIVVQLSGGNDGLNTVIPFGDRRYYEYRPNLAIPEEQVIKLSSATGLHPSLAEFKAFWDRGQLAIVEGVGYPNPSYSHFTSMDIWRQASRELNQSSGWLGRYLESLSSEQRSDFAGLAVSRSLPGELASTSLAIPLVESIETYLIRGNSNYPALNADRNKIMLDRYQNPGPLNGFGPHLKNTANLVAESTQELQDAVKGYKSDIVYPSGSFGSRMQLLAKVLISDLGLRVGHVSLGSFDTHASQLVTHSQLLSTLAKGLDAFWRDLEAHGRAEDVVIMTWSEFGRRVKSNASDGTDHGSAGPMFIVGRAVKGGFYGAPCDLGQLDNGNLRYTTDFRSVYATILSRWLSASDSSILGGTYKQLDSI